MNKEAIVLFIIGSFLPNNFLPWTIRKLIKRFKPSQKRKLHLISPKKYYIKFQSEPKVQYAYHRKMVVFWLLNFIPMNLIVAVDIWATLANHMALGLLITAVLLALNTNYSLYANFDTETGDAHAAYASIKADEIQMAQTKQTVDINNLETDKPERITDAELQEWSMG